MTVSQDLGCVADLCAVGAKNTLAAILALGPKPDGGPEALLWEQHSTRLQGQLNSLTALNSKLTAASVIAGLATFAADLRTIGKAAKDAQTRIAQIKAVSELLTKLAKVLDLGLALLAAAAAPSPATIRAAIKAGKMVAEGVPGSDGLHGDEEST